MAKVQLSHSRVPFTEFRSAKVALSPNRLQAGLSEKQISQPETGLRCADKFPRAKDYRA